MLESPIRWTLNSGGVGRLADLVSLRRRLLHPAAERGLRMLPGRPAPHRFRAPPQRQAQRNCASLPSPPGPNPCRWRTTQHACWLGQRTGHGPLACCLHCDRITGLPPRIRRSHHAGRRQLAAQVFHRETPGPRLRDGFVTCFVVKHLNRHLLKQLVDVGVAATSGRALVDRGGACGCGGCGPFRGDRGGQQLLEAVQPRMADLRCA